MSQNEALELPREERPFHQIYHKCYICGDRFRSGDTILFKFVAESFFSREAICKKCSEDEAWKRREKELREDAKTKGV